MVAETEDFANPMRSQLDHIEQDDLENLFQSLGILIHQLNQSGILSIQRTCYGCKFYNHTKRKDYCNLLDMELKRVDIRFDCLEWESVRA